MLLFGDLKLSRWSIRVRPEYHSISLGAVEVVGFSDKLIPSKPEIGTNPMFSSLKPIDLRNGPTWETIKSYLSLDQSTRSSLFTATQIYNTPRLLAKMACSFEPPPSKPLSNSDMFPSTTKIAQSAYDAPIIMLGTKSWWPGASRMTN